MAFNMIRYPCFYIFQSKYSEIPPPQLKMICKWIENGFEQNEAAVAITIHLVLE